MHLRVTGVALLASSIGLTGCASLSSLWPFHKPIPLAQVSTTESKLNDLAKQIAAQQQTLVLVEKLWQNADRNQWLYISRLSYGLGTSLAAHEYGAARALSIPLAQISGVQAPLTADDRAGVDSLVSGLESQDATDRQAAQDLLDSATATAEDAHVQQVAAEVKVTATTATLSTLQVQDTTLRTQLSSQTRAAVEADNVKNQALATWNSIKLWFFVVLGFILVTTILSHLHLAKIAKTVLK